MKRQTNIFPKPPQRIDPPFRSSDIREGAVTLGKLEPMPPNTLLGNLSTKYSPAQRITLSEAGASLLRAADASAQRVSLGLGALATEDDLTYVSTALTSDVAMTTLNTFYDGPSVVLTLGTWLLVGSVTVGSPIASAQSVSAKLWDGTTVHASGEMCTPVLSGDVAAAHLSLSRIVILGAGATLKISVASSVNGSTIKAQTPHNASGNTASYLQATKIG